MVIQYFKIIMRDLVKRKSFSLINIAGIALGFTVCILTLLYVYTELNFDRHIPDVENKYRIIWGTPDDMNAILPYPFMEKLEPQLPKKAKMCVVSSVTNQYLSCDKNDYKVDHVLFSDPGFPSIFGLSLLQGDTANVLNAPLQILLSEKVAKKLFGDRSPVNQIVRLWMKDLTVTGVFRDLPGTSSQETDAVISVSSFKVLSPGNLTSWGNKSYDYYLSLPSATKVADLQDKIKSVYLESDPGYRDVSEKEKSVINFELEPVSDIHLRSGHVLWDNDKNKGSLDMVLAFITIGILILMMACFNYINLSAAWVQTKSTFSGVQKVLGAGDRALTGYIFMQTLMFVLAGFIFSLFLIKLILPYFNAVVYREIPFSLLLRPQITGIIFFVILFMIFVAGLFPAIRFANGNPVFVLKGRVSQQNSFGVLSLRKFLVVSQFVISITLISGILVMSRQIRLMSTQQLGFNAEQLLEIDFNIDKKHFELFKDQLETLPGVIAVSAASNTPAEYINNENPFRLSRETKDKSREGSSVVGVTSGYFDMMKIRLLEGELFTPAMEKQDVAILSKTAAEMLGLSHTVGERVYLSMMDKDYTVVGTVDDIQYRSLREMPRPVVYVPDFNNYNNLVIRLAKGDHLETIEQIKKSWHAISPDRPFDFRFFDMKLQQNYTYEISTMRLLNMLVIISLLISSLGIFGLIMQMAAQRTKEIGIRKVNGAKINEVMAMLNKDFIKWVAIAFIIATPVAYYVMQKWLENFAYKTSLSWWIFALAGLLALGIALLTVSWQSWKAATRNPVEALRYE